MSRPTTPTMVDDGCQALNYKHNHDSIIVQPFSKIVKMIPTNGILTYSIMVVKQFPTNGHGSW